MRDAESGNNEPEKFARLSDLDERERRDAFDRFKKAYQGLIFQKGGSGPGDFVDIFNELGISPFLSAEELKAAFHAFVFDHHEDRLRRLPPLEQKRRTDRYKAQMPLWSLLRAPVLREYYMNCVPMRWKAVVERWAQAHPDDLVAQAQLERVREYTRAHLAAVHRGGALPVLFVRVGDFVIPSSAVEDVEPEPPVDVADAPIPVENAEVHRGFVPPVIGVAPDDSLAPPPRASVQPQPVRAPEPPAPAGPAVVQSKTTRRPSPVPSGAKSPVRRGLASTLPLPQELDPPRKPARTAAPPAPGAKSGVDRSVKGRSGGAPPSREQPARPPVTVLPPRSQSHLAYLIRENVGWMLSFGLLAAFVALLHALNLPGRPRSRPVSPRPAPLVEVSRPPIPVPTPRPFSRYFVRGWRAESDGVRCSSNGAHGPWPNVGLWSSDVAKDAQVAIVLRCDRREVSAICTFSKEGVPAPKFAVHRSTHGFRIEDPYALTVDRNFHQKCKMNYEEERHYRLWIHAK